MRNLVVTAAILASGIAAVPALAQDRAPFTGPRVEALAGYDNVSDGSRSTDGRDGFVYGGAVGYDVQLGGVVVGAEGEVTGSTTKTRVANVLAAGDRYRLEAGRDLYVGGRVGYVISPLAMVYVKGGYTNARVNERYDAGTTGFRDGRNLEGYRLGAGLEYMIQPNMYVKGEYRYSNYSRLEDSRFNPDVDRHQIVGGVGIRF